MSLHNQTHNKAGDVESVIAAMRVGNNDASVLEAGCRALGNLTADGESKARDRRMVEGAPLRAPAPRLFRSRAQSRS